MRCFVAFCGISDSGENCVLCFCVFRCVLPSGEPLHVDMSSRETSCFADFRCAGGLLCPFLSFSPFLLPFSPPFLPFSHSGHPLPSSLPFFNLPFLFFHNFPIIVLHLLPFSFFPSFFLPKKLFPSPFHRFLVKATRLFVTSLPALCRSRHLPHTGY